MFEFVTYDDYKLRCPFCEVTCFYLQKDINKAEKHGYIECKSCGSEIFEEDFEKKRSDDDLFDEN